MYGVESEIVTVSAALTICAFDSVRHTSAMSHRYLVNDLILNYNILWGRTEEVKKIEANTGCISRSHGLLGNLDLGFGEECKA